MSDLEDLDTGPDALPEEEASMHADPLNGEGAKRANAPVDKSILVKAAVGLGVVVVAGGAYFMLSSSHPAAQKSSFLSPAAQRAAASHAALPSALSGTAAPVLKGAPQPAVTSADSGSKTPDLLPAAIPPLEAGATPSGMTAPPSPLPPVVSGEMPPSSEQLTNVASKASAAPTSIDAQLPGYPAPSAAPSITAPVVPPSPTSPAAPPTALPPVAATPSTPSAPAIPAIPEQAAAPSPFKSDAAASNAVSNSMAPAQPAIQPITQPPVKSEMPMPSSTVAPVAEADLGKAPANQNVPNQNAPAIPAVGNVPANDSAAKSPADQQSPATASADAAKIQALQDKIAELKQTITQLQETPVTKEDASAKSAEETAGGEMPRAHHARKRASSSHHHAGGSAHGGAHWVLRAAKPGVAWVAKKGSDDLQMVNVGDTLRGIGTVTSISQDASDRWVINGSEGRISQ